MRSNTKLMNHLDDNNNLVDLKYLPIKFSTSMSTAIWSDSASITPIANIQACQQQMAGCAGIQFGTVFMNHQTYEFIRLIPRSLRRIGRKINRRKNRSMH